MATDPVRTAAEQLTDWLETNAVIGGTGAVFASRPAEEEIYAFARQQRKEAQDDLIAEQREWDCKYGCDGRDSCLLPDVLERAEAAEARIAVLEGELAALRAERGAEGWEPIATAPKDGTVLLGYSARWAMDMPELVVWLDGFRIERAGWFTYQGRHRFVNQPTHWRPLPPPPVASSGESEGGTRG